MSGTVRFLLALLLGLALLTVVAYAALMGTTQSWFLSDLHARSRLMVTAAGQSLARNWHSPEELRTTLLDITRDDRIMASAACSATMELVAFTPTYPGEFSCRSLLARMQHERGKSPLEAAKVGDPSGEVALGQPIENWSTTFDLPGGRVLVSLHPMARGSAQASEGFVVLVHDLSQIERREGTMRNFLLAAFFILCICASLVTLLAVRMAYRGWTIELRRAIRGKAPGAFMPLQRDVRALADELLRQRTHDQDVRAGAWSPARLRDTLKRELSGERVVILANREPYVHMKNEEGAIRVVNPASGLVSALEPVMRACSGVWIAHGAGNADRETVDNKDRVQVPPGEESYWLRRVWLSDEEENGYYYGFSNEGLWPLCHVAHARPAFRAEDFERYVRVNRRFANAVCDEAESDDPIVLVQDYHFALAPRMIREKLPRATIITFWHIPWPSAERIGICPWREELIQGLLGSSVMGFHTQQHCNHFIDSVDTYMESRIDRENYAVIQGGRRTLIRSYPISIEWPVHWLEGVPKAPEAELLVRQELGVAPDTLLGIGVDRLDYTKGIEERFMAVDELLERYPEFRGRFSFVQLAAPSRTKIDRYQELNQRVEATAQAINAKWGNGTYRPIHLLRAHHQPADVFRYYRAAQVCYVSSLHDGMNLVAKEFVAARDDEQGVLVLSCFTGAARDLSEALIVNPYDMRQASDALAHALRMPSSEQRERMHSMRKLVAEFNVYRWAGRMLLDAAEIRRKERMSGRFLRSAFQAQAEAL